MASSDIILTKASDIITDTNNLINEFDKGLQELNEASLVYTRLYEKYYNKTQYDEEYIKEKMKEVIVKAAPNDI